MLKVILGALVWRELITLRQAKKIEKRLRDRIVPETIEEIIKELEKTK